MHSSRLIESAHVGRCIGHTVLDHKSVHIASLLLLHVGIGRQSSGTEVLLMRKGGFIDTAGLMKAPIHECRCCRPGIHCCVSPYPNISTTRSNRRPLSRANSMQPLYGRVGRVRFVLRDVLFEGQQLRLGRKHVNTAYHHDNQLPPYPRHSTAQVAR